MKVAFDISAGLAQGAGVGRYATSLALAMQALPQEERPELTLFSNRQPIQRLPQELHGLPYVSAPLGNKQWRAALLTPVVGGRWAAALRQCDVVHGTDIIAPAVSRPIVATVHDLTTLLYPQHHTVLNRVYQRVAMPVMLRRATLIITDSHATQNDVIQYLGVPIDKTRVVLLGVDHDRFSVRDVSAARERIAAVGIQTPYILAVGTLEPRKNLANLLRAYALLAPEAPPLLLVGKAGWGDQRLSWLAQSQGISERVRFAGFVPDALLPDVYACADVFVYPSLYEGFGLPVLEAMACGAPVITSTTASMPETAGDAALFVDPHDPKAIACAMNRLLDERSLGNELRARGLAHVRAFTWQQTARATLDVYREAMAQVAS